ncbi:Uma2 family endonuclease [Chroococcidiopsis sp. CCMEE 29]|uniref:Uma2 family endonuclease n=1 Tax=Chroococcidiopsis sp. CCMEE 29 TaxID=155894 RepID=UPI002020D8BD|nr:Uma2 family endonuclease [Chroococcidiopsis sp. CCMEE 29]
MTAITLDLHSIVNLTDEQFYQLCRDNPNIKLERTHKGELVVMPPTGWGTGNRNIKLLTRLEIWTERDNTGIAFDSSTGFTLPNGADRSPDAAWVRRDRIEAINPDPDKFLPLAPDFVVELMSASDVLERTQAKMREYRDNGVRLGWLIYPKEQRVEIYRPRREVEVLQSPSSSSGEDVLPGFVLQLEGILF